MKRDRVKLPNGPEKGAYQGEETVNWIRIGLAFTLIFFMLLMHHCYPSTKPISVIFHIGIAASMAFFSSLFLALLKLRLVGSRITWISTAADIVFVALLMASDLLFEPSRYSSGAIPMFFFLAIGLAALRQKPALVAFSGIASAFVYLIVSGVFFFRYDSLGFVQPVSNGSPVLELNFIDEIVKSVIFITTGGIIAHLATNLKKSEKHYYFLFENIPDGVLITNSSGVIETVNGRFASLVGLSESELRGFNISNYLSVKKGDDIREHRQIAVVGDSLILKSISGEEIPVMTTSSSVLLGEHDRTVTSVREVTDQIRMERQLAYLQKMESVGELTSGMAHDLNNILDEIMVAVSLSLNVVESFPKELKDKLTRQLSIITECSQKGEEIIKTLLSFSRKTDLQAVEVDLVSLLRKLRHICEKTFGSQYPFEFRHETEKAVVLGEEISLTQALLNICTNAKEAMSNGGPISLTLSIVKPDREVLARRPEAIPGLFYWNIEITDCGSGMYQQTLERIFEPFFSTKSPGEGTGLGLTMTYSTIRTHNGFIDVSSVPQKGTIFRVHIPSFDKETEQEKELAER